MASSISSNLPNASMNTNQPLHYFTGRLRAFWKSLIFFSDQRNAAVVEIHDVYINGRKASSRDLAYLEELVERSDWLGAPEFHSYVSEYHCCDVRPPWPYELSGKTLWKAKCAWFGFIPNSIKTADLNTVCMPVSYYTGKIVEFHNDKILFGDLRNSVMVNLDHFYINGEKVFDMNFHRDLARFSSDTIHAYIIRLEVLSDNRLTGPEPHLPTWPKEHFTSDMWVAKYAWQGEMPEIVRDQIGRYYVIRMNQWSNIQSVPWKVRNDGRSSANEDSLKKRLSPENEGRVNEMGTGPHDLLVPTEQKAGLMRGSLLMADENQGLMTSFVDVIAFSKENFYVNGQKFRQNYDLFYFFQDRVIPLTAWVVPLDKPKVIFHINVLWHAVCVWCGNPPKDLGNIKKKHMYGELTENFMETTTPVSLTHFLGNVRSLSYASGVLMSRAGLDQAVKISFKRKVVYLQGNKFHSSCSLLDKQQLLESNVWSVLAYPAWTDQASGTPHYRVLVMWHYDDQRYMNIMLSKTIADFVGLVPAIQNTKLGETRDCPKGMEKLGQHLSGRIAKVTEDYGIIQSESALMDATYLVFNKKVLYMDGELLQEGVSLQSLAQGRQCNMHAKGILPKNIDGYQVTMEATLVWFGRKPSFEFSEELTPSDSPGSPSDAEVTDIFDGENSASESEAEFCIRADKILHAAEGVMVGDVLMADEQQGLIICSDIIVAFSSDIFYINGKKFKEKYSSLNEFCSDKRVTVRAVIATLKEPQVLLNCLVVCEAICVWTGLEPDDLTVLQKLHPCGKKHRITDTSKISQQPLLYFLGRMTPINKDVTLLASTTPEGTAKIIFFKENLYINGTVVYKDDIFENYKRRSQNWCVLALSVPPRDISGHSVRYAAVAVWEINHSHKLRTALLSIEHHHMEKERAFTKYKINRVFDADDLNKATREAPETLLHALKLEDTNEKDTSVQVKTPSQLNDPSVIVSHKATKSSGSKNNNALVNSEQSDAGNEFCGKHITGYIIKKIKGGGIAQWKSLQFEGFVFIEFDIGSLYLDLKSIDKDWKVADVESRPCNLYVIPVPHHSVGEYTVSLRATCGWLGKKPVHLPSPGTQLLRKIDLSSVHVTQPVEVEGTEFKLDYVDHPLEYLKNNKVNMGVNYGASLQSEFSQCITTTCGKTEGNIIQGTLNGEISKVNCNSHSQAPPPVPYEPQNTHQSKCGKIWEDKNKKKGHQRGTIVEVHSSVGQLKGADGTPHYFSREHCYLYGVSLHNVELWHVLAQDDPLLYTVIEVVPGMKKVQKVWLGSIEEPNRSVAAERISEWCQIKLVPDGAREILIGQLEMQ